MKTKLPKKDETETELLFHNSFEEIAVATNNRLLMVEMKKKVEKFTAIMAQLSEDAGIPFKIEVHFKIIKKKEN